MRVSAIASCISRVCSSPSALTENSLHNIGVRAVQHMVQTVASFPEPRDGLVGLGVEPLSPQGSDSRLTDPDFGDAFCSGIPHTDTAIKHARRLEKIGKPSGGRSLSGTLTDLLPYAYPTRHPS